LNDRLDHRGIEVQVVEIIGILVAATDREDPRTDHVGQRVGDARRIAVIGDQAAETLGETKALVRALRRLKCCRSIASALRRAAFADEAILNEWVVNIGRRTSYERLAHLSTSC